MSRNSILKNILKNKPDFVELPVIPEFKALGSDPIALFCETATATGIEILHIDDTSRLSDWKSSLDPDKKIIDLTTKNIQIPTVIKDIDILITQGKLGVAENSAIWLDESHMHSRILPFITQHLIVVLEKKSIVWNMHQAYGRINIDATGFGVFIAGPSKTADIEQSLVIGAQGARTMNVILF